MPEAEKENRLDRAWRREVKRKVGTVPKKKPPKPVPPRPKPGKGPMPGKKRRTKSGY